MTHQSMRLLRDITNTEVDPAMSLVAVNQQMQSRAIQDLTEQVKSLKEQMTQRSVSPSERETTVKREESTNRNPYKRE